MTDDELIEAAKAIRKNAYCPQSNFYVGAAIIDETGKLYIGCNVENAAYPQSSCAEAGAISAMVAGGGQRICTIAIAGGTAHHTSSCTPCGGCRHVLVSSLIQTQELSSRATTMNGKVLS